MAYALAAERLLKAIGEPRLVQTKSDARLLRLEAEPRVACQVPNAPA